MSRTCKLSRAATGCRGRRHTSVTVDWSVSRLLSRLMSAPAAAPSLRTDAEIIGLVGLAHGTSHFFHLMLPPLFPWLMRDFSLSYTEAGLLMTVFFVVSGIGQAIAGSSWIVSAPARCSSSASHCWPPRVSCWAFRRATACWC